MRPNYYIAVVALGLCAGAFVLTTQFDEVPAMLSQNVPPTFFPRGILAVICLLSIALALTATKQTAESVERVDVAVYVTGGIFLATVLLLPILGMTPTVCLVAVALALYWGERRRIRVAIFALALPAAVYVVFVLVLGMRFPRGSLWW